MTNKTKAVAWTLIIFIILSLLVILILSFQLEFVLLGALGIFCTGVYIIYKEILFILDLFNLDK